jgi:hypothetical protein
LEAPINEPYTHLIFNNYQLLKNKQHLTITLNRYRDKTPNIIKMMKINEKTTPPILCGKASDVLRKPYTHNIVQKTSL